MKISTIEKLTYVVMVAAIVGLAYIVINALPALEVF